MKNLLALILLVTPAMSTLALETCIESHTAPEVRLNRVGGITQKPKSSAIIKELLRYTHLKVLGDDKDLRVDLPTYSEFKTHHGALKVSAGRSRLNGERLYYIKAVYTY